MPKPLFNTALGALNWTLQPNLPARFSGVTARIFPLKARMDQLRAFCDSYLNIADPVVQFQPSLPYVYLMVLDYGRMSPEVANLGWVSQHEVAFAVPIEWYRMENGKPVFVDMATVCPFIFVDNELSLSTGREVFGWPKVMAWLTPEVSPWLSNPRNDMHLLSLSTMLYPDLFAGQRQQPEVLLQVRQRQLPRFAQFPFDFTNPLGALMRLPTAMMSGFTLMSQLFEMATRLPLFGYGGTPGRLPLPQLLRQGSGSMNPFAPPPALNQITLKQFRDAQHPAHACYQAIVNSRIETQRFNAAGLLGDHHVVAGDLSGGFEILIHRYAAEPIIESLGLEVARQTEIDGSVVAALAPVLPFWIDVDLEYGVGEALCWRTRTSAWETDAGTIPSPPPQCVAIDDDEPGHPFNTALGAATQDVAGPFEFPNTTLRVLPLIADAQKLAALCEKYLNSGIDNDVYSFKPWGAYVYLVVTNYEEMSSPKANLGFWAEREVTFFIPVQCYDLANPDKLLSVALVPIFGFADSETAAITSREVNGQPTLTATIESPPNAWLTESGPSEGENKQLLTLTTTVFPALTLGQEVEWRTLLEIVAYDPLPYNDDIGWRTVAESWGRTLLADHARKIQTRTDSPTEFEQARALAIEILANRQPINLMTLKQFRDIKEPLGACYQAVVRGRREIDVAYDMREIEETIHVEIHRYPSLPIVEMLGLQTKYTATGTQAVDVLQPIRPFWLRVAVKDYLGENLCWRADARWVREKHSPFYFETAAPKAGGGTETGTADTTGLTDVGVMIASAVDAFKQRPRDAVDLFHRLNDLVLLAEPQDPKEGMGWLTRDEAAAAVAKIEPQMVIDSILSKEWLNWGNPRWHQGLREKPDFCIPRHSIGEKTNRDILFGKEPKEWPWKGWYSQDTES